MTLPEDLQQTEQHLLNTVSLQSDRQRQAAELMYRDILLEHPNHPNANYNLGMIALKEQQVNASLPFFKIALEADPQEEQYWLSYISALIQAEHFEDAQLVLSYGLQAGLAGKGVESLELELGSKLDQHQLKQIYLTLTSVEEDLINWFAEQRYEDIENKILALVQRYPSWLVGWKILSDTYIMQGKDARLPALRALELNSSDAKEHCYYGLVLKNQGDLKGAASTFEQAIRLKPDYAAAYNNLGIVKKDMGDVEGGIRDYRRALELNPGYASCYSNLLFCLSHSEKIDTTALFEEHCRFSKQYELPLKSSWQDCTNQRNPDRCLQVGFVSADFRDHALAYFFEPLLNHLSVTLNLSLHAYSTSAIEDSVTQRIRGKFRYWNKVNALSDEALAKKIQEDGIDILVDLGGHTAGNRLLTFAMKPAPIQVSWLGYLATTGLMAMDYYLADSYLLPPGKMDDQFTEKLVQLPANAPFMPSEVAPEVNELPALKNGYITFACFNRLNKITPSAVSLWSKLLKELPNAKMLLGAMPQDGTYDAIIEWFASEGVGLDRLIFHPRSSMKNYLKLHYQVDICLDTFPSNGVTTTCHAVWMGVPTLCMDGKSMASRGALDVMKQMGLDDFVALDETDFVSKGLLWARHPEKLAEVRTSLRHRFEQSPLAQPAMIADGLERAFRQMWKRWCEQLPAESFEVAILDQPQVTQPTLDNGLIYVTQPLLPSLDDFIPYLQKIWDNKLLTNGGPFHQQLEQALCDYLGVKHIALFANGTLALLTALQALRITGEVITTPYSFVATAHSLLWNGIKPVFVDIDPVSLNMDPARIEAAITPQTTAIMPVHCYGHPCDVERIQKIADDYNLKVIYDAAHSFGVQCNGGSVLNYGDLSVLSFHATKVFNTFEGGAIICPDAKTKQRIDHLKNFGFVDELTVEAAGINGKMSEVNAAFGLLQLKHIDEALQKRKAVDNHYRQGLSAIAGIHCVPDAGEEIANYAYFPILIRPNYSMSRDELYQKLRDAGIFARRYFYPLISEFPMYRGMPSATHVNLPEATKAANEVICLPIYPDLQQDQINRIIDLIKT
ncbi:MAG: DegT/DnrJ/EryC1/StrS family aminotransferase [Methylotenera sp.]|nr:DegT/DnrJ/EryC1/StrS family aminotransferase [Methylotenera sp.]